MRLYHGTKSNFTRFDINKAGASDTGLVGKAIYFTPYKAQAEQIAHNIRMGKGESPRVITARVLLLNPMIIKDGKFPSGKTLSWFHAPGITRQSSVEIKRVITGRGHDGVIFKIDNHVSQVAVYDPRTIEIIR